MRRAIFVLGLWAVLVSAGACLAQEFRTVRVQFPPGASGTTVQGHLQGYETVHYLLNIRAGQMLGVDLKSAQTATYFNIFEPGRQPGRDTAVFIGPTGGDRAEIRAGESGDYLVQVFLYRAAARQGERSDYSLVLRVSDAGARGATAAPGDATVAGTGFHATGTLPCARYAGQPSGQCRFGVVRKSSGGTGDLTVFWPDGGSRIIHFENGVPTRFDRVDADGDVQMAVSREVDLFFVRIGPQRFEIPQAIITGG